MTEIAANLIPFSTFYIPGAIFTIIFYYCYFISLAEAKTK